MGLILCLEMLIANSPIILLLWEKVICIISLCKRVEVLSRIILWPGQSKPRLTNRNGLFFRSKLVPRESREVIISKG